MATNPITERETPVASPNRNPLGDTVSAVQPKQIPGKNSKVKQPKQATPRAVPPKPETEFRLSGSPELSPQPTQEPAVFPPERQPKELISPEEFRKQYEAPLLTLVPEFEHWAGLTEEARTREWAAIWQKDQFAALTVIAPAMIGAKHMYEVLQVYRPMILKFKDVLRINGRPSKGRAQRTWHSIGIDFPGTICWESACKLMWNATPQYVNQCIRQGGRATRRLTDGNPDGGGTVKSRGGKGGSKPVKLDGRQQAALVKAQVAANDLVAALKNGADWQTPLSEYEKVAVTPARLATFMNALSPEPDWKGILTGLVTTLEQYGDRLPIPVITALKSTQELLDGKAKSQPVAKSGASTKRHLVPKKQEGGTTVHAMPLSGRVKESPGGTYGSESGVEAGCERLNSSPVDEPPIAGAAGVKQPEAAETRGGEPVFPGDWVTFDSTCKYLGRFVRRRGGSLVVMRWNRKPRYGQPAGWFQSTADGVYRRLTPEEVTERFPGALEAWGGSRAATPEPALRPSSKMNTPLVANTVPQHTDPQSAAQSAAY